MPTRFNIYVHDLKYETCATCIQYADDTSIYRHFKHGEIRRNVKLMNTELDNIAKWSKATNLVFNGDKTKSVLFATRQMNRARQLDAPNLDKIINEGKEIESAPSSSSV